jgi:hypothetical protein
MWLDSTLATVILDEDAMPHISGRALVVIIRWERDQAAEAIRHVVENVFSFTLSMVLQLAVM